MIHIYGFEMLTLEALCEQRSPPPEDFLSAIEDQLESGEITEEDAVMLIKDFVRRE